MGQSKTVTFQVITDSDLAAGSVLENDAFTYSDIFDDENDDNYAYTQTTVLAAADLYITKFSVGERVTGYDSTLRRFIEQDAYGSVTAGKLLRYQIEVENRGPSTSRNVTVQDNLPPTSQVTYLYADGADCWPDDVQQNVLYCGLGNMAAGTRKAFDIYVRVDSSVMQGTYLYNYAYALYGFDQTVPPGNPFLVAPDAAPEQAREPIKTLTWDPYTSNNFDLHQHLRVRRGGPVDREARRAGGGGAGQGLRAR